MKAPAERVQDAHRAFELLWLLDLSKVTPLPDARTRLLLKSAFLAGTLHGYAEANQDLKELERRMKEAP